MVKHSSYIDATNGYLIEWITCLLYYVSAFAKTKPDPTHPIFDKILLGVDAVLCHD